ncbi:MAG: hypothetical protein N2738_03990, partial [Thermodesulfovibrionales bacterium]|nr:hypothetical protein [Thermodesulfovibrionales bacterium]
LKYPLVQDTESYFNDLRVFVFSYDNKGLEFNKECPLLELDLSKVESIFINLPLDLLNFRIITCPDLDRRKIREIIPLELEGNILTKKDDLIFDYISEKNSEGALKVLVVYTDKRLISNFLASLKERGIIPSSMICAQFRPLVSSGIDYFAQKIINIANRQDDSLVDLIKEELTSPTIKLTDKELSLTELRDNVFKPLYKVSQFFLSFLIITSLWLLFRIFTDFNERVTLMKEIKSRYITLFPEDKKISDEIYQLKSKLKVLKDKEDAIMGIKGLDVLKKLSEVKKEGITLNELTLEKDSIKMKGDAVSMEEIERFKKELSWIKGLNISNVNQTDKGVFAFSASGRLDSEF